MSKSRKKPVYTIIKVNDPRFDSRIDLLIGERFTYNIETFKEYYRYLDSIYDCRILTRWSSWTDIKIIDNQGCLV